MLSMGSTRIQKDMEDRFNCPICLSPRLKMVVGLCQHRVCDSCLYEDSGELSLTVCPVCQEEGCFPKTRPIIPEDSILAQRRLGVVTCPNDGCEEEMWEWELHEHQRFCAHTVILVLDSPSPPPRPARPRVTVQAPERPRRRQQPVVKTTRTSARRLALARQQQRGQRTPGGLTPGRRVAAARRLTPARGTAAPKTPNRATRRTKKTAWRL